MRFKERHNSATGPGAVLSAVLVLAGRREAHAFARFDLVRTKLQAMLKAIDMIEGQGTPGCDWKLVCISRFAFEWECNGSIHSIVDMKYPIGSIYNPHTRYIGNW